MKHLPSFGSPVAQMKAALVVFCALVLLLLAAVLPVPGGRSATAIYHSPVLMFLLAVLSLLCLICCLRRRPLRIAAGFLPAHLGIVLILCGAFAGFLLGKQGPLRLSVRRPLYTDALFQEGAESVPFGFSVAAEQFVVRFYPPVYRLYRPLPREKIIPGKMPFEACGDFSTERNAVWDLGAFGAFAVTNLLAGADEWVPQYRFNNGALLHQLDPVLAHFGVTLLVRDGERELKLPVAINHPASYRGWRFYLMSYDAAGQGYVDLLARCDPGRGAVIAGIWMVMIGVAILAFRREEEGADVDA
jgi:hypothetical protein